MNLVMLKEEGCREVYVNPESVESVQNAAGGKDSIVYLKTGRKLIVTGSATLGRDCCGQEIIPILGKKLSVHRNRHTNCDGTGWGWIEGCTLNICWSNNKHFDEKRAYELAHRYNESPNK